MTGRAGYGNWSGRRTRRPPGSIGPGTGHPKTILRLGETLLKKHS
jgi:hypothetical protein